MIDFIIGISAGVVLMILIYYLFIAKKLGRMRAELEDAKFSYKSMYVKHGKSWEHFVPFMQEFEQVANKDNFVFIGSPIDGIAFDDDAIKFIEIKTGSSQLSKNQKRVKQLVEGKKVSWHELRFEK